MILELVTFKTLPAGIALNRDDCWHPHLYSITSERSEISL